MNAFRFAQPDWGMLIWVVAVFAALLVWLERRSGVALSRWIAAPLAARLIDRPPRSRRLLRIGLLAVSCFFLVVALMRPQFGLHFVRTPRVGAEIMVALDVSRSMLAEDVAPNRLERAKADLRDLLPYLEGDEVGLIAFAGRATVLSPLTPDFGFLRLTLDGAEPTSVPRGGTNLAEPIRKAVAGFGGEGGVSRSILLITDGEDHDSFVKEAAKQAAERGIKILAIGFGDEGGSRIPVTDADTGARTFVRDANGGPVVSRLDGKLLRELARITDGAYVPAGTGVLDLQSIYARHIAPLTRGRLDSKGRSIRNEGFQWAVLAALVCLLAAVLAGGARGTAATLAILLCLSAAPVRAAESAVQLRERYNTGLNKLDDGDLDAAEEAFRHTREEADTDGELRYRATYNLAWVEVRRADAAVQSDPKAALQALDKAGDWFRRAVRLRPKDDAARKNLDIVAHRALILADSLAKKDDGSLQSSLSKLIETQRKLVATAAKILQSSNANPQVSDAAKRETFRDLSAKELEIDSQAEDAVEQAGREADAIQNTEEGKRRPEDAAKAVQLQAAGRYLHRGRERLGQSRSALRKLDGERAFRRAALTLTAFKRARDQLLDPVRVLDAVIADALTLARSTSLRAAADSGVEGAEAPAWLTDPYLAEGQSSLTERVGELAAGFEAALEQAAKVYDAGKQLPPEAMSSLERISEAAPLLAKARAAFGEAGRALDASHARAAFKPQREALKALMDARERFLDLRRLVELLYAKQKALAAMIDDGAGGRSSGAAEYIPLAEELEAGNVERIARVRRTLSDTLRALDTDSAAPSRAAGSAAAAGSDEQHKAARQQKAAERVRLQLAGPLLDEAERRMNDAHAVLDAAAGRLEEGRTDIDTESVRAPLASALEAAAKLRRLFFSVLDHLKEIAAMQVELGDRTAELATLAAYSLGPDIAVRSGRLAPGQQSLQGRSDEVASALADQADHLRARAASGRGPSPGAGGGGPGQPSPEAEADALTRAGTYVAAASSDMKSAYSGLTVDPPTLADVREDQDVAVENLERAIELLEPPEQRKQKGENQKNKKKPEPSEKKREAGDPGQQLQGVRDREAQRRADRERKKAAGYAPVEKDW